MKTSKFTLLILPLLFFACKKDPPIDPEPSEPVMPPLTHQGLNTFGCYINGELFVAGGGDSYWDLPPVSGSFDETTKKLIIQGTRYSDVTIREFIVFIVNITVGIADYPLQVESENFEGYRINGSETSCDYFHNPEDKGICKVTYFDEDKNIIAGTFNMTLIDLDCEYDTIMKITDGRFDFKY